jgi:beta-N-acetylglucosaminidase
MNLNAKRKRLIKFMKTNFNVMDEYNEFRWLKISVQFGMDKTTIKGKNCVGNVITV